LQFRDYWQVISKRWWIMVIVCVAAVAVTVAYSKFEQPIFRSTVRLDVSPARYDYGLTMVIENLLRQYSSQLQTDKLANKVNERLNLDLSPESLRSRIKVSPISEDYAIQIEVDDPDPNRAKDIAYAWADEFVKQHQERMAPIDPPDRIDVTIHDDPRPGELNRPKTRQNAMAAGLLGIVIGAVIAFFLEYLDDTLKTAEEAERYTGVKVLAAIPTVESVEAVTTGREKAAKGRTKLGDARQRT